MKAKAKGITKAKGIGAQPEFYTAFDVLKYFEKNPTRLVDYLERATERKCVIPTVHALQLSRKVGIPFVWNGTHLNDEDLLEHNHVAPANFKNIGAILAVARMKFPRPLI